MWGNLVGQLQKRLDDAVELLGDEVEEVDEGNETFTRGVVFGDDSGRSLFYVDQHHPLLPDLAKKSRSHDRHDRTATSHLHIEESVDGASLGEDVTLTNSNEIVPLPVSSLNTAGNTSGLDRSDVPNLQPSTETTSGPLTLPSSATSADMQRVEPLAPSSSEGVSTEPRSNATEEGSTITIRESEGSIRNTASVNILKLPLERKNEVMATNEGRSKVVPAVESTMDMNREGHSPVDHSPDAIPLPPTSSDVSRGELGSALKAPVEPLGNASKDTSNTPHPPASQDSGDAARKDETTEVSLLLRFQQQLAEEMETTASLHEDKRALSLQVKKLEEELRIQSAKLLSLSNSEEQISVLIEKLGKETERRKVASGERAQLRDVKRDLEEEVEEYRQKEQQWLSECEGLQQNADAAEQRIGELEMGVAGYREKAADLEIKLEEITHQNELLRRQVEELKSSYAMHLDTVRESNSDTVDMLRREVEQLRTTLQNLSVQDEARTAELEKEVHRATLRAHHAEERMSEMQFGSVNSLHDLRHELESAQQIISNLKAEVRRTQSEYTDLSNQHAALTRSRATVEATWRERLMEEAGTNIVLKKANKELEERCESLQAKVQTAVREAEDERKNVLELEALNQQLRTSIEGLSPHGSESHGSGQVSRVVSVATPSSPINVSRGGFRAVAQTPVNPFFHAERASWCSEAESKTRERLEQELLHQSVEIDRLRCVERERNELKSTLSQLRKEQDLLMQLYGELEERTRTKKVEDK